MQKEIYTENNYPDVIDSQPFRPFGQDRYIQKNLVIPFTTAPTAGVPYYFNIDPDVEQYAIKAFGIYITTLSTPGLNGYPFNATFYNMPFYAQIADWYLTLKNKSDDIIWQHMPLTRLCDIAGASLDGNLTACDLRNIAFGDKASFVVKKGASANPTVPFAFVFAIYLDQKSRY